MTDLRQNRLFAASLLLALVGCSSSSGSSGGPGDASTSGDARGDAMGALDTSSALDSAAADTSPEQDSGIADASVDVAVVPCGPEAGGCGPGSLCCVNNGPGFCGQDCACWTGLACANAAQCAVTTDVCCIQPSTVGCITGTQQSVCLASCSGGTQLCNPAATTECLRGSCSTDAVILKQLNLPADAGYGVCK